jgi:hypothetical protein
MKVEARVDGEVPAPKATQEVARDIGAATFDAIALVRDFEGGLA